MPHSKKAEGELIQPYSRVFREEKNVQITADLFPTRRTGSSPGLVGTETVSVYSVTWRTPRALGSQVFPPDVVYFLKFCHDLLKAQFLIRNERQTEGAMRKFILTMSGTSHTLDKNFLSGIQIP